MRVAWQIFTLITQTLYNVAEKYCAYSDSAVWSVTRHYSHVHLCLSHPLKIKLWLFGWAWVKISLCIIVSLGVSGCQLCVSVTDYITKKECILLSMCLQQWLIVSGTNNPVRTLLAQSYELIVAIYAVECKSFRPSSNIRFMPQLPKH